MQQGRSFSLDRRVPLALVFTLLLQGAAAVWWAAAKDAQDRQRDVRLSIIELRNENGQKTQEDVLQRLARLEAHAENQTALLRQLVAQTARK